MSTWLPWATKISGPPWKRGYFGVGQTRPLEYVEGEVKHSAEGPWGALLNEIQHPTRQASWHFSVSKKGDVVQHYALEDICWHSGKAGDMQTETEAIGNITLVGVEHEGVAGEPLTFKQTEATVRITRDVRRLTYAGENPPELAVSLWEHNWISPVTSCPSNRIPWNAILAELKEDTGGELVIVYQPDGRPEVFTAEGRHITNPAEYDAIKSAVEAAGGQWVHMKLSLGNPFWKTAAFTFPNGLPPKYLA